MFRSYIILCVIFIVNSIGYLWYVDRILFFLYGYDNHLIGAITPEGFKAYQQLAKGKLIYLVFTTLLSLGTLIASFNMHRRTEHVYKFIVDVVFVLAFIVTTLCIIVFVVGTAINGIMV